MCVHKYVFSWSPDHVTCYQTVPGSLRYDPPSNPSCTKADVKPFSSSAWGPRSRCRFSQVLWKGLACDGGVSGQYGGLRRPTKATSWAEVKTSRDGRLYRSLLTRCPFCFISHPLLSLSPPPPSSYSDDERAWALVWGDFICQSSFHFPCRQDSRDATLADLMTSTLILWCQYCCIWSPIALI